MRWPNRTAPARRFDEDERPSFGPAMDLPLLVPPTEEHAVRLRGALWDPATRRLVVPSGSNLPVHRFKRWLDPAGPAVDQGPVLDANPLALGLRCYRCGARTAALVGVLVDEPDWTLDPEGFVAIDVVAEHLADGIDGDLLVASGIGALRWRRSRQVPHGYMSNGCHQCDAIQGSFFVGEDLVEYLAAGGCYDALRTDLAAQIPTAVLAWAMGE